MRVRHRIPMIFSLSMMDMFCCTLGCVTFLWLVNQREAVTRSRSLEKSSAALSLARLELRSERSQALDLARRLSSSEAEMESAKREIETKLRDLAEIRSRSAELSRELDELKNEAKASADLLRKKTQAEQELMKKQSTATARISDLERNILERDKQADELTRSIESLQEKQGAADRTITELKKQADMAKDLRSAIDSAKAAATTSETRINTLEKELAETRKSRDSAKSEGQALAGQLAKVKQAAAERFEGIALTGQRVIFLVDMSGSMDLIDDKTAAPGKWPGVRDTVLRVLRSLPQLEKFQVILFSDKVIYPLGQQGQWLDYDSAQSPDKVASSLNAIKPGGNTNMYAALESAFQYRATGLDTIYLLSDGLPNIGEGLTAETARAMSESQRSEYLVRSVRTALKTRWNAAQPGKPKVRINSVGFFYESPDVGAFLWALSRENDGSFVGMSQP